MIKKIAYTVAKWGKAIAGIVDPQVDTIETMIAKMNVMATVTHTTMIGTVAEMILELVPAVAAMEREDMAMVGIDTVMEEIAIEIEEIMVEIVTLEILATENLDAAGNERVAMEGIGTETEIPDETEIATREIQDRIVIETMTVGVPEAQETNMIVRETMTMEVIAHRHRHHPHPLTDRIPGQGLARKA